MTTRHRPGGYWSSVNPIPTIQKFIEGLDKEKKERGRQIDEEIRRKKQQQKKEGKEPLGREDEKPSKRPLRRVTDPTTGKEIEIEDVGKDLMKEVREPKV